MNKAFTCCFTGHRLLPKRKIERILLRLDQEVENLIRQGVNTFISGGALGFDQMAASLIVAKREMGKRIRLVFALPCRNQDELWNTEQKRLYHYLLAEADEVIDLSEEYHEGCMKKRNRYMVEHSAYCICAVLRPCSGTGQTVAYAREEGVKIINVAEEGLSLACYPPFTSN